MRLEYARDLLRLDRKYYSSSDAGVLQEVAHRLTVAGKQVLERPSLLLDAVKRLSLKALYLPDSKRILIDQDLHPMKQRWGEAHEIGHDIIPWHQGLMLGDTTATLRPGCHAHLEAEANYAVGRLLFLQDGLRERVTGRPNIKVVRELAKDFGNSLTATLWRVVEALDYPAVGAVTCHPHRTGADFDPTSPCRYFLRSRRFAAEFSRVDELQVFAAVRGYAADRKGGPLGSSDVVLVDDADQDHVFLFETFCNRYEALTLGLYQSRRPVRVAGTGST